MPTQNLVHHDKILTNFAVANMQETSVFIASKVFPDLPVQKQSDKYFVIPNGAFNRNQMKKRADASEVALVDWKLSDDNYFAEVYGLGIDRGHQIRANVDLPLNLQMEDTALLVMQALQFKENEFNTKFMSSGVWSANKTGVAGAPGANQFRQWNDFVNSDPIANVKAYMTEQQIKSAGFRPNLMVIPRPVMDILEQHPVIIDRIKYGTQSGSTGNAALVTPATLSSLFGLEEILVMEAITNTAAEVADPAVSNETNAFVNGKNVLLVHRSRSVGTKVPTGGYTFSWNGLEGSNGMNGLSMRTIELESKKAIRTEIEMAFEMKVIAPDLGTLLIDVIA